MTTVDSMLAILPPVVAAGAVLAIANAVLDRTKAKKYWPDEKINKYRITWKGGNKIVYAPTEEEAVEGFEEKYPRRDVLRVRRVR